MTLTDTYLKHFGIKPIGKEYYILFLPYFMLDYVQQVFNSELRKIDCK